MRRNNKVEGELRVGDETVSVRRQGSSTWAVCRILGIEQDGQATRIYLDRLIHSAWEDSLCGWSVSGAVTTILEKG
jgi:hypothetical protein